MRAWVLDIESVCRSEVESAAERISDSAVAAKLRGQRTRIQPYAFFDSFPGHNLQGGAVGNQLLP